MKKSAIFITFVAMLFLAYHFSWVRFPSAQERRILKQLEEFHTLAQANDSKKLEEALGRFFSDSANIDLAVYFGPSLSPKNAVVVPEHFTKESFISFIGSVLYSLDNYGYQPRIKSFDIAKDGKSADLTFASHDWAEGKTYSAGLGVNMRFASETTCTGHVDLSTEQPRLTQAYCESHLESFPRH